MNNLLGKVSFFSFSGIWMLLILVLIVFFTICVGCFYRKREKVFEGDI